MEHTIGVESYQETYSQSLLDNDTYNSIIAYLSSLTPFEAIRQAQEINQMNGFEVVSGRLIGKWKRDTSAGENVKIKMVCDKGKSEISKIEISKIEIAKIEIQNKESKTLQKEISRIKMQQLQRGYMKLLST